MNPFYSGTNHARPTLVIRYTSLCLLFALCACSCNMSVIAQKDGVAKSMTRPPDKALVYIVRAKLIISVWTCLRDGLPFTPGHGWS